jgi:hypothetical protein
MAAELPSVSTPITDVKVPYGDVVEIAESYPDFIAACERQLALTPEARATMAARMRDVVAGTSWDLTARSMHELIDSAVRSNKVERFFASNQEAVPSTPDLVAVANAG